VVLSHENGALLLAASDLAGSRRRAWFGRSSAKRVHRTKLRRFAQRIKHNRYNCFIHVGCRSSRYRPSDPLAVVELKRQLQFAYLKIQL